MLKLLTPILWPLDEKSQLIGRPWYWEILRAGGEGGDMLDSITDSMDMHLSKLWDIVEYRGAWYAAVHGVTKNRTQLSSWTTTVTMSFIGFFNSFIEIQFTYHKIHLLQCIIQLFFFLVYFTALCSTFFFFHSFSCYRLPIRNHFPLFPSPSFPRTTNSLFIFLNLPILEI